MKSPQQEPAAAAVAPTPAPEHAPARTRRTWWAFGAGLLLVGGLLGWSVAHSPRIFEVWIRGPEMATPALVPQLLYSDGEVRLWYTSSDLFYVGLDHPAAAPRIGAIVMPIWAKEGGEADAKRLLNRLPWVDDARAALRLQRKKEGAERKPITSEQPTAVDEEALRRFAGVFSGPSKLERGEAMACALPEGSTYRRLTGVCVLVGAALRVSDPGKRVESAEAIKLVEGFGNASKLARKEGVAAIGIPFLALPPVKGEIGDDAGGTGAAEQESWRRIIDAAFRAVAGTGVRDVVFGGWRDVQPYDREFSAAWAAWKPGQESRRYKLIDEPVRLGAAFILVALGTCVRGRTPPSRKFVLGVVVAAFGVYALSVPDLAQKLFDLLHIGDLGLWLPTALKLGVVLVSAIFVRSVAGFELKEALAEEKS